MLAWLVLFLLPQAVSLEQADQLFHSGKVEQAAEAYRQMLSQYPSEPALLIRLATAEYELQQFEKAAEHFEKMLAVAPEATAARLGLGTSLLGAGRAAEAIPHLETAVKEAPGDAAAKRALADAYRVAGEFEESEALLRELLEADPNDAHSLYILGSLLFENKYYQPAFEALDKSLRINPANPRAWLYRAGSLAEIGRVEEAKQAFRDLESDRQFARDPEVLLGHVQLLHRTGEHGKALELIGRAIAATPDSPKLRYWRARLLFDLDRTAEAAEAAEAALKLDPNQANVRNLLLKMYVALGNDEEAAEQAAWLREYGRSRGERSR